MTRNKKLQNNFYQFLTEESQGRGLTFFGRKVSAILTAIQDLAENGESMGTRQLMKSSETVVGQIRTILHSRWGDAEQEGLIVLQKVAVAIKNSIEERSNLQETLLSSQSELEKMAKDLDLPLNDI